MRRLFNPTNGQELDYKPGTPQQDTVALDPAGRSHAYLFEENCSVRFLRPP